MSLIVRSCASSRRWTAPSTFVGLGLLEHKGKRVYRITPSGRRMLDAIKASDAFLEEPSFLDQVGGKISRAEINRLLEWRNG
jgi:DNA-binding PadR family transcriptional regulator